MHCIHISRFGLERDKKGEMEPVPVINEKTGPIGSW